MSHATVMVIGPTSEEELAEMMAPYCEENQVEPYFDPISEHTLETQFDKKAETLEEFAARLSKEWDEEYLVRDGVVGSMCTYNPDSKWDWYSVGGRWRGSLPLKAGKGSGRLGEPGVMMDANDLMYANGVDVARLGDIDFDFMRQHAISTAKARWEQVAEALDGRSLPELPDDKADREVWQREFWRTPVVEAVTEALGNPFMISPQEIKAMVDDPDAYIARCGNDAVCSYATLTEDGWLEPGRMGWFGMSSDTPQSRDDYAVKVNELLSSLPADTMVWQIDYHI